MKTVWPTKPLADVCEIKPPKSEAREQVPADALVSFAPMEDLGIDRKLLNASQVKPLASVVGSYTYFADGDVLLAKITPCFENGKLGIADGLSNGIGFGSSEFIVFRPSASLNKEFLYYFLSRPEFRTEGAASMTGAVGHKRVSKDFIESCLMPVPPLHEQRRIVGILDEALEGIATAKANTEKNLQNARALFDDYLQFIFAPRGQGWGEKPLGDVCDVRDGTHDSPEYVVDGVPFVTQKNIRDEGLSFEKTKFISHKDHDDFYRRSNVTHGDILISMIGANRGMACIVDDERTFSIKNVGLVKQNRSINQEFLLYFLKSPQAAKYVRSSSKGGAQEFVGLTELRRFPIPLPPLKEQNSLSNIFQSLRAETQHLESIYQQKIAALDALKKSLLYQAFAGEL
jgi:type I restriction enzyme S subunit